MDFRALLDRLVPSRGPSGPLQRHSSGSYSPQTAFEITGRVATLFGPVHKLKVADLGSGPGDTQTGSSVLAVPWRRLVSVERIPAVAGELVEKKAAALRHDILHGKVAELFVEFDEDELDLGLMLDVLDRFPRAQGRSLLRRAEDFFRLGMVVFLYLPSDAKLQLNHGERQSIWQPEDFLRLGYSVEIYEDLPAPDGQSDGSVSGLWAMKRWG